jgi:hypothetical protein
MIFETLWESAQRSELMLVDGGMCHFHLRRDGQLTIREIIATRKGAGTEMLERLKQVDGAVSIFAKCPADLESNKWYEKKGFERVNEEKLPSSRWVISWRFLL